MVALWRVVVRRHGAIRHGQVLLRRQQVMGEDTARNLPGVAFNFTIRALFGQLVVQVRIGMGAC